jgi:hypothetical protein
VQQPQQRERTQQQARAAAKREAQQAKEEREAVEATWAGFLWTVVKNAVEHAGK